MSGSSVFPSPVGTAVSYSSQLPINANNVIVDGQMINSQTYTTTITGNGRAAYFNSIGNGPLSLTINGSTVVASSNQSILTPTFSGATSITFNNTYSIPASGTYTSYTTGQQPSVAYTNGRWVVAGLGGLCYYSTNNGTTWINVSIASYPCVQAGNGYFVAVAPMNFTTGSTAYYSTNGSSWTSTSLLASTYWGSLASNGTGTWVATQYQSANTTAAISTNNGTSWSSMTAPASRPNNVFYGNGIWVMGNGSSTTIYTSSNGTSWTAYTSAVSTNGSNGRPNNGAYGNGVWVVCPIGQTTSAYSYSTNGTSWLAGTSLNTGYDWSAVIFGNGYFQVYFNISTSNAIPNWGYSSNGTTWTMAYSPVGANGLAPWHAAVGGSYTVTVGQNGSNGISVASQTPSIPAAFGLYTSPQITH